MDDPLTDSADHRDRVRVQLNNNNNNTTRPLRTDTQHLAPCGRPSRWASPPASRILRHPHHAHYGQGGSPSFTKNGAPFSLSDIVQDGAGHAVKFDKLKFCI
ncbi:MAG: hypothetical protein IPM68_14185 [Flavobacteriales bacterium]|nr:hypothetical protein [Flavobacteriales bacterium]